MSGRLARLVASRMVGISIVLLLLLAGCRSDSEKEPMATPAIQSIEVIESYLTVGSNETAFLTIRTEPEMVCLIAVEYETKFSDAKDLRPKRTGDDGIVSWAWKIPPTTTPGEWPVTIVCVGGQDSIVAQFRLVVLKELSKENGED